MQRFILFILCGLGIYSASAQLSFSHHAYMPGDSIVRQQVVYRDPGSCGRQLSWDFSFLQAAEEPYVITYHIPDSTQLQDLCAIEHRTRYYYYQTEDSLWATGYENPTTYMRYCLPELRLTYPFSYGDTLFSVFSGKGQYGHRVKLSVEGYTHVHADAEGELRLPDGVVRKALRVHTERRYVLIDGDSVHTALHTYSWYADDCRYPVLESIVYEDADTALFRTSFYYYPIERMVGDKETQQDNEEFNPIDAVFAEAEFLPNPVVSNLQINYLLLRSARIRFCLHSMLGLPLYQGTVQEQAVGRHTATVDMSAYPTGSYTLYIYVDELQRRQVIIKK